MGLRNIDEPEHFYDSGKKVFLGGAPLNLKLEKWEKLLKFCENRDRIEAISGPLKDIL